MKPTIALLTAVLACTAACGGEEEAPSDEPLVEDTSTFAPVTPAPVVTDTNFVPPDAGFEPVPSDSPGF